MVYEARLLRHIYLADRFSRRMSSVPNLVRGAIMLYRIRLMCSNLLRVIRKRRPDKDHLRREGEGKEREESELFIISNDIHIMSPAPCNDCFLSGIYVSSASYQGRRATYSFVLNTFRTSPFYLRLFYIIIRKNLDCNRILILAEMMEEVIACFGWNIILHINMYACMCISKRSMS
jgi:hypothetical protein